MRKFYFILFLTMLFAIGVNANPVTKETALKSAQKFMEKRHVQGTANLSLTYKSVRSYAAKGRGVAAKDAYYYVFNNEKGGFVIVSGDDATEEILGYSDTGTFDVNNIPDNMKELLDSYQEEITYARNNGMSKAKAANVTEVSKQVIEPLITTRWNQREPYNLQCFTTSGNQAVTGCVATAFAQVMYYHKWPQSETTAIPAYDSYEELPPTTFDWNAMLPCYTEPLIETQAQKDAVAKLFVYCGHAVYMSYGTGSSGASTSYIPKALTNYFGYENKAEEVYRSNYDASKWNDMIYNELLNARPVIYSANTSSGSGHAFICDGFDGQDLFHINWGWGGMSDGYYRLQALNPNSQGTGGSGGYGGYSLSQSAIIGISPTSITDKMVSGIETMKLSLADDNWNDLASDETTVDYSSSYGLHNIVIGYQYRQIAIDGGYDVGVGLFKGDELIDTKTITSNYEGSSYSWRTSRTSLYGFGKNLSDGVYTIKGIDCPTGTAQWLPSKQSDKYYITVEISNGKLTAKRIGGEKVASIEVTKVEQDLSSTSPMKIKVYVKNDSENNYNGTLYLLYNDGLVAYEGVYIAPGAEDFVTFAFSGSAGAQKIVISENSNGNAPLFVNTLDLVGETSIPTLSIVSAETKNVVGSKLYGNLLDCKLTLKNESSQDYNNLLTISLWKSVKGTPYGSFGVYNEIVDLSIPAGQTKTIPISRPLAIGDVIIFSVYDTNKSYIGKKTYTVTAGMATWDDNGERTASAPSTSITVPANAVAISFEGLDISGVTITPNNNPNTIYYFDADATIPSSLNGKNVVKGYQAVGNFNLQDGYSFYVPKTFNVDGTASYTRTTTTVGNEQTGWRTIVLPFAIDKVTNANNQQIDWRHSSDSENKDFWVKEFKGLNGTQVTFEDVETWMPNEPYIIGVPSELTGKKMTFGNSNTKVFQTATCEKVTNDYRFIGTPYSQTLSDVYVMNEKGNAFEPSQEATVDAGYAYFTIAQSVSPQPASIPLSTRLLGDANGDGTVNVTDVVLMVNYSLEMDCPVFYFENADINEDGKVNISDVVGVVNLILEE